jgi:hypothetical protein
VYYAPGTQLLSLRERPAGGLGNADTNNWSHTTRVADQTITPTILLHVGIGYFPRSRDCPPFDQSTIGLKGCVANRLSRYLGRFGRAGRL